MSKNAIRKNKIKNKHDKDPDEMRADHYAITTTSGKNNSNRLRKTLNEINRREIQSFYDKPRQQIDENRKIIKSADIPNVGKTLFEKLSKKAFRDLDNEQKDAVDRYKNDNMKRQKTNDYIVSKKKEK